MLYTVKQGRLEPTTCNNDVNKERRRLFGVKYKEHHAAVRQTHILERAAKDSMKVITPALVTNMELHCREAINRAAENKDMVYGKYA
ncbi:Hypothetical protein PHPALM_1269 [Phytophthora palmivora]|uniref:Uncharacterized protein n=1 Tax=Phytophthora palmivora TaxID=4796 RepID=A0A2P4YSS4_9STRA|nr:Hypothetical protein PHPALM_1269 [Phytophthora palmivora]